jgi:tRNA(fMet)-specific endonuclease VapC
MLYLLDTCVISDFVKADKNTTKKLMSLNPSHISISSISLMEINYGLELNPAKAKKIKPMIQSLIDSINILPYAESDAHHTAKIRFDLRKKGIPIGCYDILIAATSLNHGLTLITANEKEFSRIPHLKWENWRVE